MTNTTIRTYSNADLRSQLAAAVAERVEVALDQPGVMDALTAKGYTRAQAREYLYLRTYRSLAAEAGLA